jgi:GxxExxY protein
MNENELSKEIVDCAFKIHTTLGPGLFESVYETTMIHELEKRRIKVIFQPGLPVVYDNVRMGLGFRPDLVVESKVIVEIKSIEALAPVHRKQLLTYLRLSDIRLGLLINFNVEKIRDGIVRVVNGL